MVKNILLAGVGGQGILLASEVLCQVFLKKGLDVKKSDVHGMAQRGGSVVSHVRAGEKVYSALINEGEADFILSFEIMEALRWAHFLSKEGILISSTQMIHPLPVTLGNEKYPEEIEARIKEKGINAVFLDAFTIAKELGNPKAVNMVLIGLLASRMEYSREVWEDVIREHVPSRYLELNLKAFERGLLSKV